MQGDLRPRDSYSQGIEKTDRQTILHSSGCTSKTSSITVSSTSTYSGNDQHVQGMITQISWEENVKLSPQAQTDMLWWIQNLSLYVGKSLVTPPPQLIISSDAPKQDWGASCQGKSPERPWSLRRKYYV